MQVKISYFNNIRNFSPNMVPLSTAMWDPKWYRRDGNVYVDKRGVINGLRVNKLVLDPYIWTSLEHDGEQCGHECLFKEKTDGRDESTWCPFMRLYLEQLRKIDFKQFMKDVKSVLLPGQVPVLIVHEKPDRLCSERWVLRKWFEENKETLEEVK